MLMMLKDKGHLQAIPKSPGFRASIISDQYKTEPVMQDFLKFYSHLREISRAEFQRSSEYRRHVKMTVVLDSGSVEVDIDKISEYYHKSRVFAEFIKHIVMSGEEAKTLPTIDMAQLLESVTAELDFNKWRGN
jgi:hypothetical protein